MIHHSLLAMRTSKAPLRLLSSSLLATASLLTSYGTTSSESVFPIFLISFGSWFLHFLSFEHYVSDIFCGLQNADADKFSVHVHSEPGFVLNETTTDSEFFHGRQLNKSVQVVWGEPTMIEAEKLLLEAALHDPANQRFVLLSDSCVPLYDFSYTYSYIMSSPKSFVDSFVDESTGRYDPDMSATIPRSKWRKGSQWVTLVRKHAELVVNDNFVYPIFKKYCKMNEVEHEVERRTLTYTLWDSSPAKDWRQMWHPVTFKQPDAAPHKIKEIKGINHVHYESGHRTEWCRVANVYSSCFLFARKFSQGAALRLLNDGALGFHDPEAALPA
ncbi:unnamed protein product [Linum tenue]|uniref:Core-2/I-branching beta-1,6-N-acetylglucosaminyltransferase family protein n=1 Tax=Linum tenue TaxID=586396 RepID=A0AAV0JU06_9ROSI|nr:unnamed protein product [Linum tenue]